MAAIDSYKDILIEDNLNHLRSLIGADTVEKFFTYLRICDLGYGFPSLDDYEAFRDVKNILTIMAGFNENRWWKEQTDLKRKAFFQFYCGVMLIPFDDFMFCLRTLLGRSVNSSELLFNLEDLSKEVSDAFGHPPLTTPPKMRLILN